MCSDSLTLRIFLATLFTAAWMASSGGFIVTVGTVSSTSTSKNGLSTNRNPPEDRDPRRFFMSPNPRFVAVRIAWYISLA